MKFLYFYTLVLLYFLTCFPLLASDVQDKIKEREVKQSAQYRYGEGIDADPAKAEEAAMRDLSQKIYVSLSTSTEQAVTETETAIGSDYEQVTKTYSALCLQNLGKLLFTEKGKTRVIAYIDTASLSKSFETAKQKVRDMVSLAQKAESEGRIGDALRGYYWAYLLTHTCFGELDLNFEGINISDAQLALAEKLKAVAKGLSPKSESCTRTAGSVEAPVMFYYNDKPVQNLDFSYYCGEMTDYGCVSDGNAAYITLYFEPTNRRHKLPLGIEYAYAGAEMRCNPEIENLYRIFGDKTFDLFVDVELYLPWIAEEAAPKHPEPAALPKPALRNWSVTIQVLSDITDRHEFDKALSDYYQSGRLSITPNICHLPKNNNIYVALLDSKQLAALLYYDGVKYTNVRTGREYADYLDAFKGEAMVIWIGEPKE
ncbi:LPP20 family lipoprotein [bacterium]|nr:LPP20 family lipoprotein [bacterium]